MKPTRIAPPPINRGIVGFERLREADAMRLPEVSAPRSIFLPQPEMLDEILGKRTLDERAARLVVPEEVSAELLDPVVLGRTRRAIAARLSQDMSARSLDEQARLSAAIGLLETEIELDAEVQEALAALLKG